MPEALKPHQSGRGKCSVCAHEHQAEINESLAKRVSLRTLEKRWRLSKTALLHHRQNHLSPALLALHAAKGAAPVLDDLHRLLDSADAMYEAARAVSNMPLAIQAHRQQLAAVEMIAKVTGELDERPQVTVNIQQTQAFILVRSVIFEELEDHPEIRMRIAKRLRLLSGNEAAV